MLPWGQLAAIDVFNSVINIQPQSPSNTITQTSTMGTFTSGTISPTQSDVQSNADHRRSLGGIIGGVLGGLIVTVVVILVGWATLKRRAKGKSIYLCVTCQSYRTSLAGKNIRSPNMNMHWEPNQPTDSTNQPQTTDQSTVDANDAHLIYPFPQTMGELNTVVIRTWFHLKVYYGQLIIHHALSWTTSWGKQLSQITRIYSHLSFHRHVNPQWTLLAW